MKFVFECQVFEGSANVVEEGGKKKQNSKNYK